MTNTPHRKHSSRASRAALSLGLRPLNLRLDNPMDSDMRIEIVPLIDVIFCILVFFLLAAVGFSRQRAISLDLPKANTGAPQMREMVIVSLDYAGQAFVEQQPVADEGLYQAVESYYQRRPNALMVLYASKDVRYDRVVQVLDILRQVGGDRVALATLSEGAKQQQTQVNPVAPFPGSFDPNAATPYPYPVTPYPNNNLPGTLPNNPALPPLTPPDAAQPAIPALPPATPPVPAPPLGSGAPANEQ